MKCYTFQPNNFNKNSTIWYKVHVDIQTLSQFTEEVKVEPSDETAVRFPVFLFLSQNVTEYDLRPPAQQY